MHPDAFFDFFNIGAPWFLLAMVYAGADYSFNLIMCRLFGGITNTKNCFQEMNSKRAILTTQFWRSVKDSFAIGGRELTKEFRADKLSWSWPITVLAIPTVLFGLSRQIVQKSILSLDNIGVDVAHYSLIPNLPVIQYVLWFLAFFLSMSTFYRYQRQRSKLTWFARFWPFSLLRTLFFDFPLAYMILSTIFLWLEFSGTIYRLLADNTIHYIPLHPDLMYGLKATYTTVLGMGVFLTILSFLPTVMLIRERGENYSKMYYLLLYSGIATLFLLLGALVFRFDQRLDTIQTSALNAAQSALFSGANESDAKTAVQLQYFSIIAGLPGHFPIPSWLNLLLSARSIAFLFELARIASPATMQSVTIKMLERLLGN